MPTWAASRSSPTTRQVSGTSRTSLTVKATRPVNRLSFSDDRWLWQGENTRSTSVFTDEGKTQTTLHERRDEGGNWVPSMDVVLTEVA
jgi:hypothetical protein